MRPVQTIHRFHRNNFFTQTIVSLLTSGETEPNINSPKKLSSVQLELSAFTHVETMKFEELRAVTKPSFQYYTANLVSTRRALAVYMSMQTAPFFRICPQWYCWHPSLKASFFYFTVCSVVFNTLDIFFMGLMGVLFVFYLLIELCHQGCNCISMPECLRLCTLSKVC